MLLCDKLRVVLHQVRSPGNLGAVARSMANFGFERLHLSEPQTRGLKTARKLAVKSAHVLDGMEISRGLPEALGESVWVCGTTYRQTLAGRTVLEPEEAIARLIREAKRGEVALVFGGEKRGLSDEDLGHCQDVLCIPTHPRQPSMNLAQSAAVLLYLCSREAKSLKLSGQEKAPSAPQAMLQRLKAHLEAALEPTGFLNPQAPGHVLGELWRTLARARLSQREAELWLSACKQLERTLRVKK